MDKQKGILNISVSMVSRVMLLAAALLVRRFLIRYIGNDVNGLDSLYSSIIGMLSVAELGAGSAIVFSMFGPIVSGDSRQVAALYCLNNRLYRVIGLIIFGMGIALMPFLPLMISDYEELEVNVYLTFFLTLVSVSLSYVYSAKTALIEAHKNNYLTTTILTIARLIRYALQIIAILVWTSYTGFVICQIIETLIIWGLTEVAAARHYKSIVSMKEDVDTETKAEVQSNVKAMFMHKIGSMLVLTTDSLIISGFVGVVALGKYSNYNLIAWVITSIIGLVFTPLNTVIGHLCAEGDTDKTQRYFHYFYCLNFVLGVVFFLGYYAVIDNFISLCFGPGLEMPRAAVFIITLNAFIQYMRSAWMLFHNATKAFYYDRWKPVIEGLINLALSLTLVKILPEELRVTGVIAATIITDLLIIEIVEPKVVFRYAFEKSPGLFYVRNYAYIISFAVGLVLMSLLIQDCSSDLAEFFVNGATSVAVSMVVLIMIAIADRRFREEVHLIIRRIHNAP